MSDQAGITGQNQGGTSAFYQHTSDSTTEGGTSTHTHAHHSGTAGGTKTIPFVPGYETGDVLSSLYGEIFGGIIPNNDAQNPSVPTPLDGNNLPTTTTAPVPNPVLMTATQQNEVLVAYNSQLSENAGLLIAAATPPLTPAQQQALMTAIVSNTPPTDPTLLALYNSAVGITQVSIQTANNLPPTWTAASTDDADWTQSATPSPLTVSQQGDVNTYYQAQFQSIVNAALPLLSTPLTQAQITELNQAIANPPLPSDATPEMVQIYTAAQTAATANTQYQFSLPGSWIPDSTVASDWQPVNTSFSVDSSSINTTYQNQIINNTINLANQAESAAQTVLSTLPPGSPQEVLMKDFLKAIAAAIDTLENALRSVQASDAQLQDELTAAKFSELDGKRTMGEQSLDEQNEQVKKAEDAAHSSNKMSKVMKILGPIVAVITTIIGAILAPTGMGVVVMAVGIAMLAYSIADSECGLTQKFISAFKSFLAGMGSPLKYIAGALLAVAIIAAVVLVTVMSPGTTMEAAAMTGTQLAATAAADITKQMIIQVAVGMLMASNVVQDVVAPMISAMGGGSVAQEIASAVIAFIVIAVIAAKASPNAATQGAKTAATSSIQSAKTVINNAVQSLKDLKASVMKSIDSAIKQVQDAQGAVATAAVIAKGAGYAAIAPLILVKNIITSVLDTMADGLKYMASKEGSLRSLQALAEAAPMAVQMASNIIQGIAALAIAAILKKIGNLQAEMITIQAMIQMLTKLLDNVVDEISSVGGQVSNLTDAVMTMFDNATSAFSHAYNAGIPSPG